MVQGSKDEQMYSLSVDLPQAIRHDQLFAGTEDGSASIYYSAWVVVVLEAIRAGAARSVIMGFMGFMLNTFFSS